MRSATIATLLGVLLVIGGCSATTADTTAATLAPTSVAETAPSSTFPTEVATGAGAVTIPSRPERIAALSPTHVEMLFAIGAGDQVMAVDLFSNSPPEAAELTRLDSFNLSVEAVVALDPDLVILSFDPVDAVTALDAVGVPTLLLGTAGSLDDVYAQVRTLGAATGHTEEAEDLVAGMADRIDAAMAAVGDRAAGLTYYHETDPFGFYTPNSQSFIGQLYGLLGMENIADAAPDELGSGFPQLSPEFILSADPDLIFLAGVGETPETLASRDGWETLSAVAAGHVFVLDPDVASRWGPRVVDLMDAIAAAVSEATS